MELGVIPPGRRFSNHTLWHSYARHLLAHGRPINFASRWLGHSPIHPTLINLELVPDWQSGECAGRGLLLLGNKMVPLFTLSLGRTHTMMRASLAIDQSGEKVRQQWQRWRLKIEQNLLHS